MPPPLRTVVAGLGRIGYSFHLRHCAADERFVVVGVVDKEADRCAEATSLCPGACSFSTWGAYLASSLSADVVVVATPTRMHQRMACDAMARGCDVVIEKPLATSVAEVDAIVAAEQQHGRRVFLFQPHRWSAESRGMQTIVNSGKLGPLYCIRRGYHTYRRRNDWQSLSSNAGGMLNNYGVHFIDQLLHLTGFKEPVSSVQGHLWAAATRGDADDVVKAWLRLEGGLLLDLEINEASALLPSGRTHSEKQSDTEVQIHGKYGTAMLSEDGTAFKLRWFDPTDAPELEVFSDLAAPGREYSPGRHELPWQEEIVPLDTAQPNPADAASFLFYDSVHAGIVERSAPLVLLGEARVVIDVLRQIREDAAQHLAAKL
eukprot:COSAG01_NODE_11531_length_1912_cov_2.636514_1_plen_374_part_00